jgi:hypothetical protein
MSPASHLVQILLPTRTGTGQPVTHALRRTPAGIDGQVRWRDKLRPRARSGPVGQRRRWERDNIAVIEVMTDEIDPPFWQAFRRKLERELAQQEIVIRAQQVNRL